MQLKDWLSENDISVPDFAKRLDRTSEAVRRYISGERIPDRDTMPLIVSATGGQVTPNDFYGVAA